MQIAAEGSQHFCRVSGKIGSNTDHQCPWMGRVSPRPGMLHCSSPKQLDLAHELVPGATSMALLLNPSSPTLAEPQSRDVHPAARTLGLKLHVLHASTDRDYRLCNFTPAAGRRTRDWHGCLLQQPKRKKNSNGRSLTSLTSLTGGKRSYRHPFGITGRLHAVRHGQNLGDRHPQRTGKERVLPLELQPLSPTIIAVVADSLIPEQLGSWRLPLHCRHRPL
jgi:hypothetical protein